MKEAGQMQDLESAGAGRSVSTQTDSMIGQIPRLSKVNLFTLLSLWMELFPAVEARRQKSQVKKTGLVVVKNMKIIDLHCSSEDLHAGKIALIKHGSRLKNCDLYFSRKPCSACLKMIVNEDHKIGVGAVIWAERKSENCDGTGMMYFIGCGYNAFPVGSEYADFPNMDDKQKDREIRKFRYIVHAEQNALTFRCQEIKPEEKSMIFVTKCPCDECVPLIKGAGIKQIYTGDIDVGKKKADISYMRFGELQGISKFTWQLNPSGSCVLEQNEPESKEKSNLQSWHMDSALPNELNIQDHKDGVMRPIPLNEELHQNKKLCLGNH
ncbi:cytidine and dCMP deaminase domain-containing protein 1 isoform X5 [Phyllostomus discolor]|uniref:Cytidine and dCMP deaminase domain-containing protein 1 n=1 Tax=Phyllostomus discolor TaxID=89673 RepID=A0A7E6CK61_9CHIR|nr:cytidine and dCMP deaminase domain-containing protein 1 isoform X5 [Phyllostomus discolor]